MEILPCQGCKGLCCGPVPVSKKELIKIKKKIKRMPKIQRERLERQSRFYGTCMFYDLENDKCGIYSVRPEICKKFGYFKGLECFRKPEIAQESLPRIQEEVVGILSIDFTWKEFK
ncbi:YkgJ family cysteine cluster protein [Fredinandcohnia sp. 179-A 10B2 NHS]|uniref:YkgJ family cysteine cluster protein n=1 Tax=Fredinandcohnia sp. 179-A 10B2 NHS TaxID=3235176 RepID=UPI0039A1134E